VASSVGNPAVGNRLEGTATELQAQQNAEVRSLSMLSIAAVTLANGADNVGVYVPFFLISIGLQYRVLREDG
jgi:cadmium resistance protein CadD (predicted permease)